MVFLGSEHVSLRDDSTGTAAPSLGRECCDNEEQLVAMKNEAIPLDTDILGTNQIIF